MIAVASHFSAPAACGASAVKIWPQALQRYRWGSCTVGDSVNFNWIDYVIVHDFQTENISGSIQAVILAGITALFLRQKTAKCLASTKDFLF